MHVEVYMLYDLLTMFEQRPISWYHTGNPEEDVVPCFLATIWPSHVHVHYVVRADCIANLKTHVLSNSALMTPYPVCES